MFDLGDVETAGKYLNECVNECCFVRIIALYILVYFLFLVYSAAPYVANIRLLCCRMIRIKVKVKFSL